MQTNLVKKAAFITSSMAVAAALTFPAVAAAQQYGGKTPSGGITIIKEVRDKKTGNYVKNLSVTDTTFRSGDEVTFRVTVKNTGETSYGFIDVKDVLPSYLEFVSGPGQYNATTREVSYRIENFTAGKSDTREIKGKVVEAAQLPSQQGVFCVNNTANLRTHDGATAQDTAQACISNQAGVTPSTILPATGPILTAAIVGGLLVAGGAFLGLTLRKAKH